MDETFISVENLSKVYSVKKRKQGLASAVKSLFINDFENVTAVDNISYNIKQGEIVGYIGSNGAGKSTTIKMLVGILKPTSGHVRINGMDPFTQRKIVARDIGVVFGQRSQLFWDIPVLESIRLIGDIYRVPKKELNDRLEMLTDALQMKDILNVSVRQLSLGQRMRAEMCAALVHNPKILLLDEPTIGLDVYVKESLKEFIRRINTELKTTVILTSHDIPFIQKLCKHIILIDKGKIMYDGNLDSIISKYGHKREVEIVLRDDIDESILDSNDNMKVISYQNNILKLECDSQLNIIEMLSQKSLSSNVLDVNIKDNDLEDIIYNMLKEGGLH